MRPVLACGLGVMLCALPVAPVCAEDLPGLPSPGLELPGTEASAVGAPAAEAPALELPLETDPCWRVHQASFQEWVCAAQHVPPEGKAFALSLYVIDLPKLLVVLDSGATAEVGRAAAQAITKRFKSKPFFIVNSQPKPEHVLGNIGFKELWSAQLSANQSFESRVIAGQQTAKLMAQRCPVCIEKLAQRMGSEAVKGTQPVIPAYPLQAKKGTLSALGFGMKSWAYELEPNLDMEQTLTLRNRDMAVEWVPSGVHAGLVPDLGEGQINSRIEFLGKLKAQLHAADKLLTAAGPVAHIWVQRNLRYFAELQLEVLTRASQGASEVELIHESIEALKQAYPQLQASEIEIHQLNVQRIYRQVEDMTF